MFGDFQEKCNENCVSPVIGVILIVAIVIILAALIGTILFGFTDQLDGGSTNAAFELNKQDGTITPIQTDNGTEYDVIVDGSKTKTIPGNSVGEAIQIDNASSGSNVQIVNPEKDQVVQEWEIDDDTTVGRNNGGGDNDGGNNNGAGFGGDGLVLTVNTTNYSGGSTNDTSFKIDSGNGNEYKVKWSEGNKTGVTGSTIISWNSSGTYQVEITGNYTEPFLPSITFSIGKDARKIESIDQWGDIQYESMERAFFANRNMKYNANDKPDLSNVDNMRAMFADTREFNGSIGDWDVSNVENMRQMFDYATGFNSDISSWDTSNVTNMKSMFRGAFSFNQNISSWCVSQISSEPEYFDSSGSGFEGETSKQPNWGTSC